MPPWEHTPAVERVCEQCEQTFQSKRPAKFCSATCRNRSRGPRPYNAEQSRRQRDNRNASPTYRARTNANDRQRTAAIKTWLNDYKLSHGCVDCGYDTHAAALDFDHVRGEKTLNISSAKSIAQAQSEIAKCEVVCANCHRVRSFARLHSTRS